MHTRYGDAVVRNLSTIMSAVALTLPLALFVESSPLLIDKVSGHEAFIWTFIASAIASIVGFAYSPIAGSVIFYTVPDHVQAVSILLISSIALQTYSVLNLLGDFSLRAFLPFLVGGLLGLAPGLYLLVHMDPMMLTASVGVISATYGVYTALGATPSVSYKGKGGDLVAGFLGGLTGPIAAFPGAFVTIWCAAKGGDRLIMRSTYQPFILVMQILCLTAFVRMFPEKTLISVSHVYYVIPAILGAYIGLGIFRKITSKQFQRFLGAFLIIAGVSLLAKASGIGTGAPPIYADVALSWT